MSNICSYPTRCHGISVTKVQAVRIQDSMFNGLSPQLDFESDDFVSCSAKLLTLLTTFTSFTTISNDNKTIQTNATDFLFEAESMVSVYKDIDCTLEQEETEYASSKLIIQY